MARISQFVDANDITGARSAGIRDQGLLFQLGRQLRDLDQQFQFNQQANPLRLSQLEQDLINSREINRGRVLENDFAEQTFDTRVDFTELGTELRRDEATVSRATVPDQIEVSRQGAIQAGQATQSQELSLFQQRSVLPSTIQAQIAQNQSAIQQIEVGRQLLAQEGVDVDRIIPPQLTTILENMNAVLQQVQQVGGSPERAQPAAQPTAFEQAFNPLLRGESVDPLGAALDRATPAAPTAPASRGAAPLDSFGNPLGSPVPVRRRPPVNITPVRATLAAGGSSDLRIMDAKQTRLRNPRGAPPVSNGGAIVRRLFPQARITQTRRSPNSRLGRANSRSFHVHTNAAVDVAPIRGVTFQEFVNAFADEGWTILEAIDEVRNPSSHATGPHWHIVLGEKRQPQGGQ